jgi:hypothetical protein
MHTFYICISLNTNNNKKNKKKMFLILKTFTAIIICIFLIDYCVDYFKHELWRFFILKIFADLFIFVYQ